MQMAANKLPRVNSNEYLKKLMADCNCSTLTEFSKLTDIPPSTLEYWAYNGGSPLRSLELCLNLLKTGKSLETLLEGFQEEQEQGIIPFPKQLETK